MVKRVPRGRSVTVAGRRYLEVPRSRYKLVPLEIEEMNFALGLVRTATFFEADAEG